MYKMRNCVSGVSVIFVFDFFSSYAQGERGYSPARDYPKPWLDFLYEQRCLIIINYSSLILINLQTTNATLNKKSNFTVLKEILKQRTL